MAPACAGAGRTGLRAVLPGRPGADQDKQAATGLGLAIVAALVAAHGGTVALDTAPGEGATFRITLPLAPEAQRDQPVDAADAEDEDVLASGDGTTPLRSPGGQPPEPPAPDPHSTPSGGLRRG